ncbi:hypothetical protein FRC07_014416, partial [Ceratobasidium sp. 392]
MAGKKSLPVLLPNGTPPTQSSAAPPPQNGQKQVLRVNRACNACRKQKMRCEGPDNPPCARCKAAGIQCVFEKIAKPDGDSSERLRTLETQFATMQGTLMDILSELRRPAPAPAPASPRQLPKDSPAYSHSPAASQSSYTAASETTSLAPPPTNAPHRPALGYQYQPQLPQQLPSLQSVLPHHYHSHSHSHTPPNSSSGFSRPYSHSYPGPQHHPHPHLHTPNAYAHHNHPRRLPDPVSPYRPAVLSGITSAANSDDEGDIPSSALLAPIGVLNDLASVAAQSDSSGRHGLKRKRGDGMSPIGRSIRRASSISSHRSLVAPTHASPPRQPESALGTTSDIPPSRTEVSAEPETDQEPEPTGEPEAVEEEHAPEHERDAIEKGIVSEGEAGELHRIYFTGCYRVLAVFNERVDTLDSLRARSPFLLNCILMAASKARDGGGPPSPTQLALVRECSSMAKEYLFGPLKSVEIVQGLLLIAGWSHSTGPTGWLAAVHNTNSIQVMRFGTQSSSDCIKRYPGWQDEKRQEQTGTWCGLYVFEYQISFGTGRPAMMRGDKSLIRARDILLKHPLSIPTDARLVSTCELMTLQSKIHDNLGSLDEPANEDRVIEVLRQSILDLDAWLAEWTSIMEELGLDGRDLQFFHSSAQIQMLYAHLFHHCIALRNLHTVADARALRPEMKQVALRAIDYAQSAIKVCLENHEYRLGLRY